MCVYVDLHLYISTYLYTYVTLDVCLCVLQFPMYGYTAYSSSKFALRGLAEVLQQEVDPYNIKISISFPPDTGICVCVYITRVICGHYTL